MTAAKFFSAISPELQAGASKIVADSVKRNKIVFCMKIFRIILIA